jgi:Tol biopolymer transport system component
VYLYDMASQRTKRVSRSQTGTDPDGASYDPAISGDGRFVAFVSEATNLTSRATGRTPQIYLQELASGRVELVSRTSSGGAVNGRSLRPALSFDGSVIAFQSLATNLLCEGKCPSSLEDINLLWDVFVHDRATNRTARMSADGGDEWMETSRGPSIDGAGRMVAFGSWHPIGIGDAAHDEDLFLVRIEPARLLAGAPAGK